MCIVCGVCVVCVVCVFVCDGRVYFCVAAVSWSCCEGCTTTMLPPRVGCGCDTFAPPPCPPPAHQCFTSEWVGYAIYSLVIVVVYVIGLPLGAYRRPTRGPAELLRCAASGGAATCSRPWCRVDPISCVCSALSRCPGTRVCYCALPRVSAVFLMLFSRRAKLFGNPKDPFVVTAQVCRRVRLWPHCWP
jgi:hypothetical protein